MTQSLPTVNGLFYGDGDDARYTLLGVDQTGSCELYYAVDESNITIYLVGIYIDGPDGDGILEASDNVFAPEPRNPYVRAVGWNQRRFDQVLGSDHARFRIRCDPTDGTTYDFNIDLLDNDTKNECDYEVGNWYASVTGTDGGGTYPPVLETTSSMAYNMTATIWDVDRDSFPNCDYKFWQSPDVQDDLTPLNDGYPGYNDSLIWEWSTVYEMSFQYGWCPSGNIEVSIWDLHASPWKPDWTPPDTPLIAYQPIEDITPLPLFWNRVISNTVEGGILVKWSTYQEANVSHFEIERAATGVDYEQIGRIEFDEGRTFSNEWEFMDVKPYSGYNYYRIKAVDHDGSFSYSPYSVARFEGFVRDDLRLYPNPASDALYISGEFDPGSIRIEISDQLGKKVLAGDFEAHKSSGDSYIEVDVSPLPNGIYFVNIPGSSTKSHRFLKE